MKQEHLGIRVQLGIDMDTEEKMEMLRRVGENPLVGSTSDGMPINPAEAHVTLLSLFETGHTNEENVSDRLRDASTDLVEMLGSWGLDGLVLQARGDRLSKFGNRLAVDLVTNDGLRDLRSRSKEILHDHCLGGQLVRYRPHISVTPQLKSPKKARARSRAVEVPEFFRVTGFDVGVHHTRKPRKKADPNNGYKNKPNGRTR